MSEGVFPLEWPDDWPRTHPARRTRSRFQKKSFGVIRDQTLAELERMGAAGVQISTNVELRQDGLPRSGARNPDDPGAAIYFRWRGQPYVLACDTYQAVWENVHAIGKTIAAMRTIERHGASQLLERAFSGFTALPPAGDGQEAPPPWWTVLGLTDELFGAKISRVVANPEHPERPALLRAANAAFRFVMSAHHPDKPNANKAKGEAAIAAIAEARQALET